MICGYSGSGLGSGEPYCETFELSRTAVRSFIGYNSFIALAFPFLGLDKFHALGHMWS